MCIRDSGKPLVLTLILAESLLLSATGAFVGLGLFRIAFPVLKEGLLNLSLIHISEPTRPY